jgi:hypothetical protein
VPSCSVSRRYSSSRWCWGTPVERGSRWSEEILNTIVSGSNEAQVVSITNANKQV